MMDLAAESKRFDPDGNYVRRWLPVLARLPAKYIHTPWEAPEHVLDDAGGQEDGAAASWRNLPCCLASWLCSSVSCM